MGRPRKTKTLFQNLLALKSAILYKLLANVFEIEAAYIEQLQREQLDAGIRADGTDITPDYTNATIAIKQAKGQPVDRVTLRDTGDFYESIFAEVFGDAFEIGATDPKTAELRAKYGEAIFGLTAENKQKLINHLRPKFVQAVKRHLGL